MTEIAPITHGNALSVYFLDPEDNRFELYVDMPWYVSQPCRVVAPIELPVPELDEVGRGTCTHIAGLPAAQRVAAGNGRAHGPTV